MSCEKQQRVDRKEAQSRILVFPALGHGTNLHLSANILSFLDLFEREGVQRVSQGWRRIFQLPSVATILWRCIHINTAANAKRIPSRFWHKIGIGPDCGYWNAYCIWTRIERWMKLANRNGCSVDLLDLSHCAWLDSGFLFSFADNASYNPRPHPRRVRIRHVAEGSDERSRPICTAIQRYALQHPTNNIEWELDECLIPWRPDDKGGKIAVPLVQPEHGTALYCYWFPGHERPAPESGKPWYTDTEFDSVLSINGERVHAHARVPYSSWGGPRVSFEFRVLSEQSASVLVAPEVSARAHPL